MLRTLLFSIYFLFSSSGQAGFVHSLKHLFSLTIEQKLEQQTAKLKSAYEDLEDIWQGFDDRNEDLITKFGKLLNQLKSLPKREFQQFKKPYNRMRAKIFKVMNHPMYHELHGVLVRLHETERKYKEIEIQALAVNSRLRQNRFVYFERTKEARRALYRTLMLGKTNTVFALYKPKFFVKLLKELDSKTTGAPDFYRDPMPDVATAPYPAKEAPMLAYDPSEPIPDPSAPPYREDPVVGIDEPLPTPEASAPPYEAMFNEPFPYNDDLNNLLAAVVPPQYINNWLNIPVAEVVPNNDMSKHPMATIVPAGLIPRNPTAVGDHRAYTTYNAYGKSL